MLRKLEIITNRKTGRIIKILPLVEYTAEEFLEESQKRLGRGITKVSMENIPEIPVGLLGNIQRSPFGAKL